MEAEKRPNATTDTDALKAVLAQLTVDQMRFVIARQECASDKEAAEAIEVSPHTVRNWKYKYRAPIDEAVRLMVADGVVMAAELRRRSLSKAMAVKVAGLDADDDRLRQNVSTEIIEWEMGKAAQPLVGNEGGPLVLRVVYDEGPDLVG